MKLTTRTLCIFTGFLLFGCATQGPFRLAENVPETPVTPAVCKQLGIDGLLAAPALQPAYIEIDAQGNFEQNVDTLENRNTQMHRAFDKLRADHKAGQPHYVVVYVHGWFHNAAAEDENVIKFKCSLGLMQQALGVNNKAALTGIYIGWRGKSVALPVLKYLTFWDRKNTSERAGRGQLVEFMIKLERRVKDPSEYNHHGQNRLLLVGHSFGASVVFNSVGQIMLARLIESGKKLQPIGEKQAESYVRGYGDMVVLVNPAIEALRLTPFYDALNNLKGNCLAEPFPLGQPTRMMILSSLSDGPNNWLFPLGRRVSTLFESYNDVALERRHNNADCTATQKPKSSTVHNEKVLDRTTMGQYERLYTHSPITRDATALDKKFECKMTSTGVTSCSGCRLAFNHLERTDTNNPLWIVPVTREVMAGHSDVVSEDLICMFGSLAFK